MPIDFKYVPVSGALSGKSFEEQTEQAINELGVVLDESNAMSEEALGIANNALKTANNALNTAENSHTDAQHAAAAASQAQATADAARDIADSAASTSTQAYDLAAQAESVAGTALNSAQSAGAAAESASAAATQAVQTANVAQETADSAFALAELANGIFTVDETRRDANEAYDGAEKSYLTNVDPDLPNLNFPAALSSPIWFEVSITDDGQAVLQTCRDDISDLVCTRKGVVDDDSDPERTIVTWSEWTTDSASFVLAETGKARKAAEQAMGLFAVDGSIRNADESWRTTEKSYLTNTGNLNFPAALTSGVWFEVLLADNMQAVTQVCRGEVSDQIYTRTGTINNSSPENPVVTFGPWNSIAAPEVIKSVTTEVNPAGQPEGTYLVIVSEATEGEVKSYINLTQIIGSGYKPGNSAISISADNKIALQLDSANSAGLAVSASGLQSVPAGAATATAAGTGGTAVYAPDSDKTSRNRAATPAGVAAQITGAALTPAARTIATTAPLTGGGNLTANRTLAISAATAATATTNGSAGSVTYAASNNTTALNMAATPAGVAAQISGAALTPTARTISTTAPLTGGGNLTANRTLGISAATAATAAADGMAGSAVYAKDSDTTSRNKAATPAGVAAQITTGKGILQRQIFTTSGAFTAPRTGAYKVTAIGGGGGGGQGGGYSYGGGGGAVGGTSSFGSISAAGGGGGGGGGRHAAAGGGGAGLVTQGIVNLTAGQVAAITVGGSGAGGSTPSTNTTGINGGGTYGGKLGYNLQGGGGANGASNGSVFISGSSRGNGGAGAFNSLGYGHGGGGGGSGSDSGGLAGTAGGPGAKAGGVVTASSAKGGDGGSGAPGAIIIEWIY